jgi:polysaccharide pyruvyl transferase WcaK-like protein
LLGINVTKYFDAWLEKSEQIENRGSFLDILAAGIKQTAAQLNEETGDIITPLIFSTQPMDESTCWDLARLLDAQVIDNTQYLSHDIQAVMKRCDVFMGMRFHSLVLASAVEVPIIGLVYAPKVRGFMRLMECENFSLELASISPEGLQEVTVHAWKNKAQLKMQQKKVVDKLKAGARQAARTVAERYFPERARAVNGSAMAVGE